MSIASTETSEDIGRASMTLKEIWVSFNYGYWVTRKRWWPYDNTGKYYCFFIPLKAGQQYPLNVPFGDTSTMTRLIVNPPPDSNPWERPRIRDKSSHVAFTSSDKYEEKDWITVGWGSPYGKVHV